MTQDVVFQLPRDTHEYDENERTLAEALRVHKARAHAAVSESAWDDGSVDDPKCPSCEQRLVPRSVPRGKPDSWDDLVYRCDVCGIGFSNATARRDRRRIVRSPEMNVPEGVRDGLTDVLGRAANVRNRPSKRWKFCSEKSEDAVTWTVVRTLTTEHALGRLLPPQLASADEMEPAVLLWGVPVSGPGAEELRVELEHISDRIGERPASRSEPDVIVAWRDVLAIVEAKLTSKNDSKPATYSGWSLYHSEKYFRAAPGPVAGTGLYELVRNWRIGCELAGRRRFVLVNLSPIALDADADKLRAVIREDARHSLVTRVWVDVLADASQELVTFARSRGAA